MSKRFKIPDGACWPVATLDDWPEPCGDWEKYHKANNLKYTLHLIMGIAHFSIAIATGIAFDWYEMNWSIPEMPGPRPGDDE